MKVLSATIGDLLIDLANGNPPPEEQWFSRDWFYPMHGANELRAAARKGLIELETSDDPEKWRFRFTEAGRSRLCALQEGE